MTEQKLIIPIKLLTDSAKVPQRAKESDAGYDFFSDEEGVVKAKSRKLFKTGVAMAIPVGYYGRNAPRSGYALKQGIDVLAGVIDAGYRNEIGVILYNTDNEDFIVEKGMKIAQIIFERCYEASFVITDTLPESQRGLGGFGHTGN